MGQMVKKMIEMLKTLFLHCFGVFSNHEYIVFPNYINDFLKTNKSKEDI